MYSEDLDKIVAFIKKINPDVVCLQELTEGYCVGIQKTGEWIAKELGYHHHCAYGPMILPDGVQTLMGNGILSRLPFTAVGSVVIQEGKMDAERIVRDERYYLQVSMVVDGKELCIGTTHLPFHPLFITTSVKQRMIEQILDNVPAHDRYILAGDFNSTPHTKAIKTFRQKGLRNAGPSLIQPTWTTKPFVIGHWNYSELRYRLDYTLNKTGVRSIAAKILRTELSDHLPILVNFELT